MKILLINGSPKGQRSNSLRLATSFIGGVRSEREESGETVTVEELHIASMNISSCKGCFACWQKTPGICCIKDDMQMVLDRIICSNLIVWSFPLYYFGVPGILKNLIDRQLPMKLPFMSSRTDGCGGGSHPSRYEIKGIKHVLISTCGFYSAEGNYDSVTRMFDHFLGQRNYTAIFCGQGELFRVKELSSRTDEYLSYVRQAGSEYAAGKITEETNVKLHTLLYPKEVFEAMADASWGIARDAGQMEDKSLIFTRQMAALYNKDSYDGRDRVLEICYTDLGKTYQILLGKDGAEVRTDGSLIASTRIDTPWEVWVAISRGDMRGDEALAKHLYRTSGDFSLMMNWGKYFGSAGKRQNTRKSTIVEKASKPPLMITMLSAWITLWVAVSIHTHVGALVTLFVCACLPLIMGQHELCIYDKISFLIVALLAVLASVTGKGQLAVVLGYFLFGSLWLFSCLTKEPLCAAYVKYSYGENALNNPIFMRTNYRIAVAWGVLYILTAGWTLLLSGRVPYLVLILLNQTVPILLGLFTAWFQKWYPAKIASEK